MSRRSAEMKLRRAGRFWHQTRAAASCRASARLRSNYRATRWPDRGVGRREGLLAIRGSTRSGEPRLLFSRRQGSVRRRRRKQQGKRLTRSHSGDDQGEVSEGQQASAKKLEPMLFGGAQLKESGHASNDEQKMGDAADEHHQCIGPGQAARAEERPKLSRSGLEEVGNEQA